MALSEQEQKLLAQLEASLMADDPKFVRSLRGTDETSSFPARRTLGVMLGEIVGAAVLVAGLQWHWLVSVGGFAIMFGVAIVGSMRPHESDHDNDDATERAYAPFHGADDSDRD
jgi:hypothetical protein